MEYVGHTSPSGHQSLREHSENVAKLARHNARSIAPALAEWVGWVHDLGKADEAVQDYLLSDDDRDRGPDHSSAGMMIAKELPVQMSLAGHHGGLDDVKCIKKRLKKKVSDDRIARAVRLAKKLLSEWNVEDPNSIVECLPDSAIVEQSLCMEMLTRLLHSSLVDADIVDTATFYGEHLRSHSVTMQELYNKLEDDQKQFANPTSPINKARSSIYDRSVAMASSKPGLFNMTVPTGGGKTRALMGFALRHAVENDLDHVIVALPYTSIIDQNADIYRSIFGEENVLEYHSSVDRNQSEWYETLLSADNWDAPIVVTTIVQLLETMFSNRNSQLRKFHRYTNSCIVIDEVQSVPAGLTTPTIDGLKQIIEIGKGSVVFCTATQPDYTPVADVDSVSIITDTDKLYKTFERVQYHYIDEEWTYEELASKIKRSNSLTICNTTADAAAVAAAADVDMLSTRLCKAHRDVVLKEATGGDNNKPLVSTQVVEAGVDISYPVVYRAVAPMISIIQAAGRCNRNAEQDRGDVYIYTLKDGNCPPGAYATGRDLTKSLLQSKDIDLNHADATKIYYRELFGLRDPDANDVQKYRKRLHYPETNNRYKIIDNNSIDVVVNYKGAHDMAYDLQHVVKEKGYLPPWVRRKLQPYTVSLYEYIFDLAVDQGQVTEIAPDLWILNAHLYDSHYGVLQERIKDWEQSTHIW